MKKIQASENGELVLSGRFHASKVKTAKPFVANIRMIASGILPEAFDPWASQSITQMMLKSHRSAPWEGNPRAISTDDKDPNKYYSTESQLLIHSTVYTLSSTLT